jgi:L-lactate utilization protein LutB
MSEQFYNKRLTQECYKVFQEASSQYFQENIQEALKKHPMGKILQMVIKSQMPKIPDLLHKLDNHQKTRDFIGQAAQNIAEAYEADIAASVEQKDGKCPHRD